jgi:peptide/nickel transport system substrate-binding protein
VTTTVERTLSEEREAEEFHCLTCGSISTLDPVRAYNATSCMPLLNIYEPLVALRSATLGALTPMLSVEVPDTTNGLIGGSGDVYRFPIRSGVRFHHGEMLEPADVRDSLLRLASCGPTTISSMLREALIGREDAGESAAVEDELRDAIVADAGSVVLRLRRPFAPLLALLATRGLVQRSPARRRPGEAFSEPEWSLEDDSNGTGPFRLERFDRRSQTVILKRNEVYWGRPARLRRIVIRVAPPDSYEAMRTELLEGRADSIVADWRHVADLESLPGVRVIRPLPNLVSRGPLFCVSVDPRSPYLLSGRIDGRGARHDFFSDIHARRAFAHAFDADRFIAETFAGSAVALRGPIPPALLPGHPVGAPDRFDLDAAAVELRQAWSGAAWQHGFHVQFGMNSSSHIGRQSCRVLTEGLRQLGDRFVVEPVLLRQAEFEAERDLRRFPIFDFAWMADVPDAHDPARCFVAEGGFATLRSGLCSSELTSLVDEAKRELNPERRASLYARIQEGSAELCPAVTLVSNYVMRIQRESVEGWEYIPGLPGTQFSSVWKRPDHALTWP